MEAGETAPGRRSSPAAAPPRAAGPCPAVGGEGGKAAWSHEKEYMKGHHDS